MADIVIFSRTAPDAYRHDSIADGIAALGELAGADGLTVAATEDAAEFTSLLDGTRAVVWWQCNGTVLESDDQRAALLDFVQGGGGFSAIHNTTAAEADWPEFVDLVGARFVGHPPLDDEQQPLRVVLDDGETTWPWSDEWYEYDRAPRDVEVVLTMPDGAPLAWHGTCGAGRTWQTALGHRSSAWRDERFRRHVWDGVLATLA